MLAHGFIGMTCHDLTNLKMHWFRLAFDMYYHPLWAAMLAVIEMSQPKLPSSTQIDSIEWYKCAAYNLKVGHFCIDV